MTLFLGIVFLILGFILGRIYGWMKYHYPEFQEEIKLRVARKRLERAKCEAETEEERMRIDKLFDREISKTKKATKAIPR